MLRRSCCLILLASFAAGGCAYDTYPAYGWHQGGYSYAGQAYAGPPRMPYAGDLTGPGVETLDEWLRGTREGRAIVTLGFGEAGGGFVSEDVANRANIWFRRYADSNRDMVITDPEIRTALVAAAGRYLPPES